LSEDTYTNFVFAAAQPSPEAKLRGTALPQVTWSGGFWKGRFKNCRDVMVPAMWDILNDDELSHAIANFRIAAGREPGSHEGPSFWDGDVYKWLEAAISVQAVEPSPKMAELIAGVVELIAKSQREDGYIHTPVLIAERYRTGEERQFQDPLNFEMYNMGHLMTTACLHRAVTGDNTFFRVAERACDFLEVTFANPTPEMAAHSICPSHFMGLADMYRVTGDQRYVDLFKKLFNMRDLREGGEDQNQDRIPFRQQRKAIGHAVRANYLYAGAADLFAETGERALMDALEPIWDNLVTEKIYITGACGAIYDGASPDGSADHHSIQLIHQAYGREYQLPNLTAYNESCATIGNLLWNWRMLKITANSRYADILELTLLNGVLSGISLEGTKYFYANALERTSELPFPLRWSQERESYITSFCCPPNTVRTIAQASAYVYATSERAIWTIIYGDCDATIEVPSAGVMRLRQQTDYPWDGQVNFVVESAPADPVTLNVRIPQWADRAALTVNGESLDEEIARGSYVPIERRWSEGDIVRLELPMPVRLMEAHPLVEEDRNQVAVMRGPLVYCLESADLPDSSSVQDAYIRLDAEFELVAGAGVLEGMTLLGCSVDLLSSATWEGVLYRPASDRHYEKTKTRLIPYFAWDNRDAGEMAVWLKVRC